MHCIYNTVILHKGLSTSQLREAVLYLQNKLGPEAQNKIFDEFIKAIKSDTRVDVLSSFDHIQKIDVNNSSQFGDIFIHLKSCMEVVFFWLNNFVFPTETKQFPEKLVTNAWNVCDQNAIGFSGTNDNHKLLPKFVHQIPHEEKHLRGTNGEMIHLIIERTKAVRLLRASESSREPLWKLVLEEAVKMKVRALIDVSGLMAGVHNREVLEYLCAELDQQDFSGVVYFDAENENWSVYETGNRQNVPLSQSSFSEADCFVYFDQSRCRGADMKLPTSATALVTIEPKLTKDRFLQGCARMRKLKGGQGLILAGTPEALCNDDLKAKDILESILRQTSRSSEKALPSFYQRGLDYYKFPKPSFDDLTLSGMYSGPRHFYRNFADMLEATMDRALMTAEQIEHATYCKTLSTTSVDIGNLSGECEQEVTEEEDKELEEECESATERPFRQEDWNFEEAFSNPKKLFSNYFIPLSTFTHAKFRSIASINWGDKVYCSPNFVSTIERTATLDDSSQFLRPVKTMLVAHDGRIALLSTYETDKLLPIWWNMDTAQSKASLHHLTLADRKVGIGNESVIPPVDVLATVKLFRGNTSFTQEQLQHVKFMFRGVTEAPAVVRLLLHSRNRLRYFSRSDLEEASTLLEDFERQGQS